jgi:hypothetical protein
MNTPQTAWTLDSAERSLYQGWNLLAILRQTGGTTAPWRLHAAFDWTHDLSRTPQGAGGVGGLMAAHFYANGIYHSTHYPVYDGNGNVTALVLGAVAPAFASTLTGLIQLGQPSARYEYDPFRQSAPPHRLPLLHPLPRTLAFERLHRRRRGLNLYGMVGNDTVNRIDFLGLMEGMSVKQVCGIQA